MTTFRPWPLLSGFHRQTLAGALLRGEGLRRHPPLAAFEVDVALDCRVQALDSRPQERGRPLLVVVHGMGGSARSTYMQAVLRKGHALGMRVVLMNLRGADGTEHLSVSGYHGGLVEDLFALLDALDDPGPRLLLGFSLGGNIVLRAAALGVRRRGVAAVAAISPAVDLGLCAAALDDDERVRFYRDRFVRELADHVRRRARAHPGRVDTEGLDAVSTLTGFDDRFTAPVHGFRDVHDYYARASSAPLLGEVDLPSLVLHARDDLLVPVAGLELSAAPANPCIELRITERGGHCAFLSPRGAWAETEALGFLSRHAT